MSHPLVICYTKGVCCSSGETTYSLEAATALRQQLANLYNEMEGLSKRILVLKSSEESSGNTASKLQQNVRNYTISYIQESSFTLPTLPDQKKLLELIAQKEQERRRKVQMELQHNKVR